MFEAPTVDLMACPRCGSDVRTALHGTTTYQCPDCQTQYKVFVDDETGQAVFLAPPKATRPEPLGLPRGSVRALTALVLSGTCWFLIGLGRPVPAILLNLLLTVLGFYFGLRSSGHCPDQVFDPRLRHDKPLNLPAGCIRMILLLGFGCVAILLAYRGDLETYIFLEFFTILAGLLVGNLFRKFIRVLNRGQTPLALLHGQALLVILAAFCIAGMSFLTGGSEYLLISLCVFVSFYYGSRS